jgi:hypothetical protein
MRRNLAWVSRRPGLEAPTTKPVRGDAVLSADSKPDGCGSGSTRLGSGCISPALTHRRSGVACVCPVYRPPAQRGRGWASNAVAEVSRRIQVEGARVCLFTDQANPTSNKIYVALGYRPMVGYGQPRHRPLRPPASRQVRAFQGDDAWL